MNDYLRRLGLLLWRLVPANPILVRVVQGASRRMRHLWIRFAYLVIILFVVLVMVLSSGGSSRATLADLAKNASTMFMYASMAQLALMCVLAPIFTAGAITQERDAQTFNILIATPLSNAQIVLGSLMSRLYFVMMLLVAGLPIFLMMMVYGGVTFGQITQSFGLAATTAILTGSLAICLSMIRVGTRQTILSFYVMIGLYLVSVWALGQWKGTWVAEAPANVEGQRMSWLAAFHPFLALDVALNRVPAPDVGLLAGRRAIAKFILAYPHQAYMTTTLMVSAILTVLAFFFVRQPKEGEIGFFTAAAARLTRREAGERRRKPRRVWSNPVAWREARSRATAATKGFMNFVLLGGGLVAAIVLFVNHLDSGPTQLPITRDVLSVIIAVEMALILLAATNTAATAMTKDKESQTMDLLLATPLTSRYIVWGKLRGLVTFTVPLICIPTFTMLLFGIHGLFDVKTRVVPIETALAMPAIMLSYAAASCMFGLWISLHNRRTVRAVMVSVGVVVFVCLVLTLIFRSIVEGAGVVGAFIAPMTPFTGVLAMTNPLRLFDSNSQFQSAYTDTRVWMALGSAAACFVYLAAVGGGYKSMVRNFDMVMRKQSAQM